MLVVQAAERPLDDALRIRLTRVDDVDDTLGVTEVRARRVRLGAVAVVTRLGSPSQGA